MDIKELWQKTLNELEASLSKANYQTWFKNKTKLISYENEIATIGCNLSYTKEQVENRYYTQIKRIIDKLTERDNAVVFTVSGDFKVVKKSGETDTATPLFDESPTPPEATKTYQEVFTKTVASNLNPNYTFETFVVGNNNRLAHAVAQAISANPAKAYNPFVIYGGVGVGKTHLMQAVGQNIIKDFNYKVLYCTSEAFTNEMIESIQEKRNSSFRNKYRGVDVLLIDDIQFIAGRETTQEEFFHTFNELHGKGKQIIMTSDRPPKDIAKLEARLRSRFEGGMIADIQTPDIDMRQAILLSKARQQNLNLPPEIITFLATNITSSIRDLEGSLIRVVTQAQISGQPLTLDLAKSVIGVNPSSPNRPKVINPQKVVDVICTYFSVKPTDLKGASRQATLVLPRQVTMYLLRIDFNMQFMRIADILGRGDHTTVMHGVDKIKKNVENDTSLRELIEDIRTQLWT